jgi:hypothetical protein
MKGILTTKFGDVSYELIDANHVCLSSRGLRIRGDVHECTCVLQFNNGTWDQRDWNEPHLRRSFGGTAASQARRETVLAALLEAWNAVVTPEMRAQAEKARWDAAAAGLRVQVATATKELVELNRQLKAAERRAR